MSLAAILPAPTDAIVVHDADGVTTGRELATAVDRLEADLRAAGLGGRAVGVHLPNRAAIVAAWFAIWRTGGAFVPLNPLAPAAEAERAADRTGIAAVLGPDGLARRTPSTERVVGPDDAIVQFTSGTTGEPKAVVLAHATVTELLDRVIGSLRADASTQARMPNLVPVSCSLWAGIYQVLFAFRLGVPVVLMDRFDAKEFARLVREHGIRSSVLPPAAMVMLLHEPAVASLEPLRYVRSVSAPLSPAHARRFHERFGIAVLNGYGQTELGGEAVGWTAADWKAHGHDKLGSVGKPHPGFRLRVRGDAGALLGVDGRGELEVVSGSALPSDDPTLTDRITDDGWLRTGDLARIDADGYVWICGRLGAMVNRGGLKVSPDEVEEVLRAHPDVDDAAVAGRPDDRLGEVPRAWLVLRPGAVLDADALAAWCRDRLAPYKVPAGWTACAELPRNEIGKLLRHELG
ncbi:MAG: class I adenylate-forming enzyme family protein [Actinomycetota bacterium]